MPSLPASRPVIWHHASSAFRSSRRFKIILVGCGGNGTRMLLHLTRLSRALKALGGPRLSVTVYDGDHVSEANLARQPFHPADLNQPKASTLVHRINCTYGTDFKAWPKYFTADTLKSNDSPHLLIGCVDTVTARKEMHDVIGSHWANPYTSRASYYLDLGNSRESGQVLLGTYNDTKIEAPLPLCGEKWPEIIEPSEEDEDEPSCSTAEALRKQDLFVNDQIAAQAIQLLWRLFRHGKIRYHGAFCNLETGHVRPIPVPKPPEEGAPAEGAQA